MSLRLRHALRAAGLHLLASVLIGLVAAGFVFGVWFPYPYRELVGGRELFLLVVSVDIVCGPLLTLVMFNHLKSRRELVFDLGLVVLVQVAALIYGLHTVVQARPVYLVFDVDRFHAITFADIQQEKLRPELGGLQVLGWGGPKIIGVREPQPNELLESLGLTLGGIGPSVRPDWWVPYTDAVPRVLQKARPIAELLQRKPQDADVIFAAVSDSGLPLDRILWLPVTSFKSTGWVALLDRETAEIHSFAPVDAF